MSKETNHIDDLFRSGLENAGLNPPPGVWESISAQVAAPAAAGSAATVVVKSVWTWVICGAAVVAGTVAYIVNQEKPVREDDPIAAELRDIRKESAGSEKSEASAKPGISEVRPEGQIRVNPVHTPENKPFTGSGNAGGEQLPAQNGDGGDVSGGAAHRDHTHVHPHTPAPAPVAPPPSAAIQPGTEVACPRQLNIEAEQGDGLQWHLKSTGSIGPVTWYFGDGITSSGKTVSHTYPARTRNYLVKAVSLGLNGCTDSAFVPVSVVVAGQPEVFIPDYLTPNGDGINDELIISIGEVQEFDLVIFDKYNRQVFVTNNPKQGWNGRCGQVDCEAGNYTAVLSYRLPGSEERLVLKKRIMLKRQ